MVGFQRGVILAVLGFHVPSALLASPFDGVPSQARPGLGPWTPFLNQLSDLQRGINQTLSQNFFSLENHWDWGVLGTTLLVALLYGSVHALSPGHGKTMLLAQGLRSRKVDLSLLWGPFFGGLLHVATAVVLTSLFTLLVRLAINPPRATLTLLLMLFSSVILLATGVRDLWQLWGRGHQHRDGWLWITLSIGLVPCPISTLLFSVALAQGAVGPGLLVCALFGIGLGVSLTTVAVIPALFGQRLEHFSATRLGAFVLKGLPVLSALVFLLLGGLGVLQVVQQVQFLK